MTRKIILLEEPLLKLNLKNLRPTKAKKRFNRRNEMPWVNNPTMFGLNQKLSAITTRRRLSSLRRKT